MSVANAARGEAGLAIGGETLVLRPSFEALVAAEAELGSLFALVERAAEGRLTLAETAALFWHCDAFLQCRGARHRRPWTGYRRNRAARHPICVAACNHHHFMTREEKVR